MGMPHTDYQPTEYEEMLITAKWIRLEDVDAEYQEHKRCTRDPMSYQNWQYFRHRWNELNAEYERDVEPHYKQGATTIPFFVAQTEKRLLDAMCDIEAMLGY